MHCFALFLAGIVFWFIQLGSVLTIVANISFTYLFISEFQVLKGLHPFGGYANRATFLRLAGTMVLFSFSGILNNLSIAVLLTLLISLDGLDGFLARRFKQETRFGANFDMETDALFACFVSVMLFEKGLTGAWILPVGFLRYGYVILIYFLRMHRLPERRTKFGPAIAVILFIALILPFVLPNNIYIPILVTASVLVSFSFGWSFYLLILEKQKITK